MSFRDDLAAAHARIEALERENAELREELDRLTGRARVEAPQIVASPIGEKAIWLGARIQAWQFPYVIYSGEAVDDESVLRRADFWSKKAYDLVLAPRSHPYVARIGPRVIAQLADLRLVAIHLTDGAEIASVQLQERLIARPFAVESWIACVTESGEMLHVDPAQWRVTGSEPYRASVYPLPSGIADACRNPEGFRLEDDAGWRVVGALDDVQSIVLALERNLGQTEMAIARVARPKGHKRMVPMWITRIDMGDPSRMYIVDGVTVVHSSGLPTHVAGVVDRDGVLQARVDDALANARMRLANGNVFAI